MMNSEPQAYLPHQHDGRFPAHLGLVGAPSASATTPQFMDSRPDEDEDEELMPHSRAVMGMKFHDDESNATAHRVGVASIILGALVVLHFIVHLLKQGKVSAAIAHLILGLALPAIGYRSAQMEHNARWRPRFLWLFHIGNVVFVIVHGVVLLVVTLQVLRLQALSTEEICSHRDIPYLSPATRGERTPEVVPTMPPTKDSHRECIRDVNLEKSHAPGLLMSWALLSIPYWLCAGYAAYHSHDLYLQLRIRELTVRRGPQYQDGNPDDRSLATVTWVEAAVE